jgi:phage portal protein BeeE
MDALANAFADADRSYMAASKAVGGVPRSLVGGMPTVGSFSSSLSKANEQYRHYSNWVYVACKTIAAAVAKQPICVGRVGSQRRPGRKLHLPGFAKSLDELIEPLPTHTLLDVIQNPNALQVQWSLLFSTVASLMLTGRSLWWFNDDEAKPQIWPIPSHWFEPADQLRRGWKIRPPGFAEPFDVPAEDAILFSLPDPSNPFGLGVSPLQSQAMAVNTDEQILTSQAASFNSIHPHYAIRIGSLPGAVPSEPGMKPVLEPEQRLELVTAIKKLYSGTAKAGEPLILDGLIEGIDRISNTAAEMDYLNSGEQVKARILQAFGLNPIIVGEIENANRASAAVAGTLFAEHTVSPIVELMSQTLTRFANQRFASPKERLLVWIEPVRGNDPEQRLQEFKAGLSAGAVTPNEFRTAVLNLDAMAGGDVVRDALGNPVEPAKSVAELSANGHRFN